MLLFRRGDAPPSGTEAATGSVEVLLGHMGGPFWAGRDDGAWSIPKGEYGDDESPEQAARREFGEELGLPVPDGEWLALGSARQPRGKVVTIWAVEGTLDPADVVPGTFSMQWPPGSGRIETFPEIDRVEWFSLAEGARKVVAGQRVFLDRLTDVLQG